MAEGGLKVIDILVEDHRRILELLACLDRGAERVVSERRPPARLFELGAALGSEYADKFHHFKEEYLLFGVLAQKHEGHLDNMIERHRNQHELGRDMLSSIASALDGYDRGVEQSLRALQENVLSYVRTMRAHIRSENEVFFPLAAAALTETEADVLLDQFERYERVTAPDARTNMDAGLREMVSLLG